MNRFILMVFGCVLCLPALGEGEVKLDIRLDSSALKDPLIEVVLPPKGSKDTLRFSSDGMLIQQVADVPGITTGVAGLKLLSNVEGDFSVQLDFSVLKLARPSAGWGQGLVIRILTDDKESPVIAFGCMATMKQDRMYWVNFQRGKGEKPIQQFLPSTFQSGSWKISREGNEITLSVQENESMLNKSKPGEIVNAKQSPMKELVRSPCTKATLQGIHVWSVRQELGNTEAEFLLKRLQLRADGFLSFKEAPRSSFWYWVLASLVVATTVLGAVLLGRKRV
jgi:hypothetical protein